MIFMGSDAIALPGLEAIRNGRCGPIEIIAVFTQPDRARGRGKKVVPNEIKTWAIENGIPVFQPEKVGKAARLQIEAMRPDSILVMAYGHFLSQKLIEVPRYGIWNLHTSLLPKYRGASPIQGAVANGDSITGVSLMSMVLEMDAGPVLDVEKVSIGEIDTALDVEHRLSLACVPLLERELPRIHAGVAAAEVAEQDVSQVSYVRKLRKEDGELDFRVSARVVARRINGLFPWPSARFYVEETPIKAGLASCDDTPVAGKPGEVLGITDEGLQVACDAGSVFLKRLQRPGGKMLEAAEFVRGFDMPIGMVLESRSMPELVAVEPF